MYWLRDSIAPLFKEFGAGKDPKINPSMLVCAMLTITIVISVDLGGCAHQHVHHSFPRVTDDVARLCLSNPAKPQII